MDFSASETMINLARAFAGESQAKNRYQLYAGRARKDSQAYIAKIFEDTAVNEQAHSKEFLKLIVELSGTQPRNIDISAGYPYEFGSTLENLAFAAEGERDEFTHIYPDFAKCAEEEGFLQVAEKFRLITSIEKLHSRIFTEAHEMLRTDTLFRSPEPKSWRCLNCGHIHYGDSAWDVCPVCGHPTGFAESYIKMS